MFSSFDRSRLRLRPLAERQNDLDLSAVRPLERVEVVHEELRTVAGRILEAKRRGAAIVLMMGAHVLRSGVQRYLLDLMEQGDVTSIGANGACAVHDFELALIGGTTESVARYIRDGRFGLWEETGRLNDIVRQAAAEGAGLGEAVGRAIEQGGLPHREISLFAAAWRLGIPITVHVGIGYDIVHQHPNCDGAAWGATSFTDFLRFAGALESLEGGVVMGLGSAVMAPEVFLKALSMVRNAAAREGRTVDGFTTLVCDLRPLPGDLTREAPKDSPDYYFRPWKTMLVRTVAGSGGSYYVRAPHAETVPQLWSALAEKRERGGKA